jgi:hypothetical protein
MSYLSTGYDFAPKCLAYDSLRLVQNSGIYLELSKI